MTNEDDNLMIAWISKAGTEVIPFHRIICVKRSAVTGGLCVRMEGDNVVNIGATEIEDFMEKYRIFLHVSQLVEIQPDNLDLDPGPGPTHTRKKKT